MQLYYLFAVALGDGLLARHSQVDAVITDEVVLTPFWLQANDEIKLAFDMWQRLIGQHERTRERLSEVNPGFFSVIGRMPEGLLTAGFTGIQQIGDVIFEGVAPGLMDVVGKINEGGTKEEVMTVMEQFFSGVSLTFLRRGLTPRSLPYTGLLSLVFEGASVLPVLENAAEELVWSETMLTMIILDSAVKVVQHVFVRNEVDMTVKQIIDLLSVRELVNAKLTLAEGIIDAKLMMAETVFDVVNSIGRFKIDAVGTAMRPLLLAIAFMSELVSAQVLSFQDAVPVLHSFVPKWGFHCGEACDGLFVAEVLGGEEETVREMVRRLEDIEALWHEYTKILGPDVGLDFAAFIGGERGCENLVMEKVNEGRWQNEVTGELKLTEMMGLAMRN